ncbi:hypothetical protein [Nocardioides sp. InS609-2]|uniref:hypothetical protein n=1 Tax=Nocardioides sp. InS609-2 TaxID=2760705 RepID=UPI0020C035CA|nr:hypothetical protein [Nocardioides sp. InS609-2]
MSGRSSLLTRRGEHSQGSHVGGGTDRDVQGGVVVPLPRWTDIPQHPISEPRQAVYDDATRPDDVASSFDAHVDG